MAVNTESDAAPAVAAETTGTLALTRTGDVSQVVLRCLPESDIDQGLAAWQELAKQVPVLRARLGREDRLHLDADMALDVQRLDWLGITDPREREDRLGRFLAADRAGGFPTVEQPLNRITLIRWEADEWRLVLSSNAGLLDAGSLSQLLRIWLDAWGGRGEPFPVIEPQALLKGRTETGAFWSDYLADYQAPDRLTLKGAVGEVSDGAVEWRLSAAQSRDIRSFRKNSGATLNTIVRAAWGLLLGHYLDQDDIVCGVLDPVDLAAVGNGAERLRPLRIGLAEDLTVGQLLRQVRGATRRARDFSWQYDRDAAQAEHLFEYCIEFHWDDPQTRLADAARAAGVEIESVQVPRAAALVLEVCDEREILLRLQYRGDRFDADAAQQILRHYAALLLNMTYQPGARALTVPYLAEQESRPVLWPGMTVVPNETATATLVSRFAEQAVATPDRIAVATADAELSYRELDQQSTRLAWRLRAAGVVVGSRVGLCVERDTALPIGILGILKAGAAYVPLDPGYPAERFNLIMEDAELDIVVAPESLHGSIPQDRVRCVTPMEAGGGEASAEGAALPSAAAQDLAYLIYTSGSTGRPKGVMVTHHNAVRLFDASRGWLNPGPEDVWTLFHSFAFDFSVWEIWGALLYGGRLDIVPETVTRDPEAFYAWLAERGVTVLSQTPSAFLQLAKVDAVRRLPLPKLRFVIFAGEALDLASLRGWVARHGDRAPVLVNMYGITETTVHVTYRPLTRDDIEHATASLIGYPLPDLYIRLLGRSGRPVPPGVTGEICVGGAGVARGYLKRPELNQQRFVHDALSGNESARLYRSGDYARQMPDGELAYLGRHDDQVKIRGFRIDLGEITSTLRQLSGVRDGVVVAREGKQGVKRLVGYYVADPAAEVSESGLREQLAATLPGHMIPALLIAVPNIPLTRNNKADVKSLPEPVESNVRELAPEQLPQTATEQRLAEIWCDVLERRDVGRNDDFFALGGDSLLALQVVARAREQGLALQPRQLFARTTLGELAALLEPESGESRVAADADEPPPSASADSWPLTPMQRWFFAQAFESPNYWNQAFLFRTPVLLNIEALEAAAQRVVARHDALHAVFRQSEDGEWQTHALPAERAVEFSFVELEHLKPDERAEAIDLVAREVQDSLDIRHGPLVRVSYFSGTDPEGGRLLIALHHLVADSLSWRLFMQEIETAYRAFLQGREPELPTVGDDFSDWARYLQARSESLDVERVAEEWHERFADAPFSLGKTDASARHSERDAVRRQWLLPASASRVLIERSRETFGANTEDCLLAALAIAAGRRYPDRDRLGVELKRHGRPAPAGAPDIQHSIGWFSSLHPFVLNLMPEAGVGAVIRDVKTRLQSIPDQGLEWGMQQPNQLPGNRLLFNFRNGNGLIAGDGLFPMVDEAAGPWHSPENHLTHALELNISIRDGQLAFDMRCDPGCLAAAELDAWQEAYRVAVLRVADFCRAHREPLRTPSDFPDCCISQSELDAFPVPLERVETLLPLAPIQRLYHAASSVSPQAGFEQWVFRLEGSIDTDAFEYAWQQLIKRHRILRSVFVDAGQREARQVILRPTEWHLDYLDWRSTPEAQQREQLDAYIDADRRRAFDLTRGPMTRVALIRLADERWQLIWSYHLIQIDGWSWPLLLQELGELYDARRESRQPQLAPEGDYAAYLQWLARRDHEEYASFWSTQLAGMQIADGQLPATPPSQAPSRIRLELAETLSRELEAAARECRVPPSVLFQAAWSLVFSSWRKLDRPVIGAVFSGRTAGIDAAERMVGPFVNALPVRLAIDSGQALGEWLGELRSQYAELNHYQNVSPSELLEWAGLPAGRRLFESLLVFQNVSTDAASAPWGKDLRVRPVSAGVTSAYPLTVVVTPGPRYRMDFLARQEGPAPEVLEALARQMTATLSRIVRERDATLGELRDAAGWSLAFPPSATAVEAQVEPVTAATVPVRPGTSLEQRIAAVCRGVLGRESLGCEENFFDLGAQSLSLIEIHAQLQTELNRIFPIVTLFQYPTVAALARYLEGAAAPADADIDLHRGAAQRAAMRQRRARAARLNRPG